MFACCHSYDNCPHQASFKLQTSYQTCEGQRSYDLDPEKKRLPSDLDLNLMTKLILCCSHEFRAAGQ